MKFLSIKELLEGKKFDDVTPRTRLRGGFLDGFAGINMSNKKNNDVSNPNADNNNALDSEISIVISKSSGSSEQVRSTKGKENLKSDLTPDINPEKNEKANIANVGNTILAPSENNNLKELPTKSPKENKNENKNLKSIKYSSKANEKNNSLITLYRNRKLGKFKTHQKVSETLVEKVEKKISEEKLEEKLTEPSPRVDFIKENIRRTKNFVGKRIRKPEPVPDKKKSSRKLIKIVYRKPELLKNRFGRYGAKKEGLIIANRPLPTYKETIKKIRPPIEPIVVEDPPLEIIKEEPVIEEKEDLPKKVSSRRLEELRDKIKKIRRDTANINRAPLPKDKLFKNVTDIFSGMSKAMETPADFDNSWYYPTKLYPDGSHKINTKYPKRVNRKRRISRQRGGVNRNSKDNVHGQSEENLFNQGGDWHISSLNPNENSNKIIVGKQKRIQSEPKKVKTSAQQKVTQQLKYINLKKNKDEKKTTGKVFKSTKISNKDAVQTVKNYLTTNPIIQKSLNKNKPHPVSIKTDITTSSPKKIQ